MVRTAIVFAVAAFFAWSSASAPAAPPWARGGDGPPGQSKKDKGFKKKKGPKRGGDLRSHGGPPPWAPAHG